MPSCCSVLSHFSFISLYRRVSIIILKGARSRVLNA
jgi:hypothetical protein